MGSPLFSWRPCPRYPGEAPFGIVRPDGGPLFLEATGFWRIAHFLWTYLFTALMVWSWNAKPTYRLLPGMRCGMDYLDGNGTIRALALKHSINPGTAEQRAKRERWTARRSEVGRRNRRGWRVQLRLMAGPNPPSGCLPPAVSLPDGPNFASLNERFHGLAAPLLERIKGRLG